MITAGADRYCMTQFGFKRSVAVYLLFLRENYHETKLDTFHMNGSIYQINNYQLDDNGYQWTLFVQKILNYEHEFIDKEE